MSATDAPSDTAADKSPSDPSQDAATSAASSSLADVPGELVVMSVSETALGTVLGIRAEEPDPDLLALRVAITGVRGSEFTYDLAFEPIAELSDDHVRYLIGELSVAIPQDSVERMMGSTLDLPKTEGQGGLVIRNPNRADPLANITVDLTGELPEQVATLLAEHINPSLAAHGGFAELVGVDEDKNVYVTMGGGCQGCSLSAATLQDGIRSAIKSNIPEILEVIDATDHTAGQNPFYT